MKKNKYSANYAVMGNFPAKDLFGSDSMVEIMLKGLNYSKGICKFLGAERNPPYIWNKNMPEAFYKPVMEAVTDQLSKDINWQPTDEFVDALREKLAKI